MNLRELYFSIKAYFLSLIAEREKHEFDLNKKIKAKTDVWIRKDGLLHPVVITGWQCKKCNKVLWLSVDDMFNLPSSMKYCDE